MKFRGFTLIELLVVIAIIAILAAILFPVFAQAKLAAKKTAALSNTKEIGLSEIMYAGDFDDYFVLGTNATYGNGPLLNSSGPHQLDYNNDNVHTWVYLTQPYMKNFGILIDPAIGDNGGVIVGAKSTPYNQDLFAQFGYNYMFLSPWYGCVSSEARSSSSGIHPSDTVMFTNTVNFTTHPEQGWYASNAPGAWPIIAPSPFGCIWWDGTQGSGNWSSNNGAVGKITASVRAVKPYNGSLVVFTDGHAKFMNDGALSAGTDYGTAVYTNANSGAIISGVTNLTSPGPAPANYLWDLDGTLNDLYF